MWRRLGHEPVRGRSARRALVAVLVAALLAALALAIGPALVPLFATPAEFVRLVVRAPPDTLPVPVAGVPASAVRSSWHAPRDGGRVHEGVDIFAPRGTPVLATTDAVVWSTRSNRLGGHVVWLLGPGRQLHYYAHLDRPAGVATGDRVRIGDVIGTVGDSGNARGGPPHLHYGIYGAGGAIDPQPLIRGETAATQGG